MIAALDFFGQQPVDRRRKLVPTLACFASGQDPPGRLVPAIVQRILHRLAPGSVDIGVGHHWHPALAQLAAALFDQAGEQPGADPHLVGRSGDIHGDYSHASIPFSTACVVLVCGPPVLCTWIGASA